MTTGQTLANIRQQYNIPITTSDLEVIKFAAENNINIDFSSNASINYNALNAPSSNSLFGNFAQPQTNNSQNLSLKLNDAQQNTYLSTNNTISVNTSVFSIGNNTTNGSYGITNTGLNQTTNQNIFSTISTSDANKTKTEFDMFFDKLYENTNKKSILRNKPQPVLNESNLDKSKIVKREFIGGIARVYYDTGETFDLMINTPDGRMHKRDSNEEIVEMRYENGQVVHVLANGDEEFVQARYGEYGYIKDGTSIDEDLEEIGSSDLKYISKYNDKIKELNDSLSQLTEFDIAEVEKTDPKKAEKMRKEKAKKEAELTEYQKKCADRKSELTQEYIKKIYKDCGGDPKKINEKIDNLIKNSDMKSEAARNMVRVLGAIYKKQKALAKEGYSAEQITDYFAQMINASSLSRDEIAEAIASESIDMDDPVFVESATNAAKQTNTENSVANVYVNEIGNAKSTNTASAMTDGVWQLSGKEGMLSLAEKAGETDGNENISGDEIRNTVSKKLTQLEVEYDIKEFEQANLKLASKMTTPDQQQAFLENVYNDMVKLGASTEQIKEHLEVVAQNLPMFHEDAQALIDEFHREHDIDNVYNISLSEHIQELAAKNQEIISGRTIDSGNEDAINNIAKHAYEMDSSSRDNIISQLQNTGIESTIKALEEAREQFEAQIAAKEKTTSEELAKTSTKTSVENNTTVPEQNSKTSTSAIKTQTKNSDDSNNKTKTDEDAQDQRLNRLRASGLLAFNATSNLTLSNKKISYGSTNKIISTINSKDFKEKTVAEKKDFINNMSPQQIKETAVKIAETADATTLKSLMYGQMKNEILKYLINHPTYKNKESLKYLENFLSADDMNYVKKLEKERNEV